MFLYGLIILTFVFMIIVVTCGDFLYTFNEWLKVDNKREWLVYIVYVALIIIAFILEKMYGG